MKCLVFKSGGLNLKEFMSNKNHFTVPIAQRVHILKEIVAALNFLHDLGIFHFDVKPENIVCFPSNGSDSNTRWKFIDFDASYDVNPPGGPPLIRCSSSNDILLTEEYTSPEVMRVREHSSIPGLAPVEVSWRQDIWSLGLVAVFLLSNTSLWEALYPTRAFQNSMVSKVIQPQIKRFLRCLLNPVCKWRAEIGSQSASCS
jgi:serine/threonine protein kinase